MLAQTLPLVRQLFFFEQLLGAVVQCAYSVYTQRTVATPALYGSPYTSKFELKLAEGASYAKLKPVASLFHLFSIAGIKHNALESANRRESAVPSDGDGSSR